VLHADTVGDIDAAFASLVQTQADALQIPSVLFFNRLTQLVTLAARNAVSAIYWTRDFTEAGGLMSYGSDVTDQPRQAGVYTGRIPKGEKPAAGVARDQIRVRDQPQDREIPRGKDLGRSAIACGRGA
jgi:putative tryptophan/tyrosine transport system substrate-binding protein